MANYISIYTGAQIDARLTNVGQFVEADGTANALTVALNPPLTALVPGMPIYIKAASANTGAVTLNVDGLGAKSILHGSVTLDAGDIQSGQLVTVMYDGTNFQMMQHKRAVLVPSGTVAYIAASSAPAGWLKANGAAVSRTTYAALFAVIGTTFGDGDGSTTFNLPDLRGEFVRGWDDSRGVDSGRAFGSAQADAFKSHLHQPTDDLMYGGMPNAIDYGYRRFCGDGSGFRSVNDDSLQIVKATGGTETRPRNVALLACIKY
jgi:hypothetical protein